MNKSSSEYSPSLLILWAVCSSSRISDTLRIWLQHCILHSNRPESPQMSGCWIAYRLCWRICLQSMWPCPWTFHCSQYHHWINISNPLKAFYRTLLSACSSQWMSNQEPCRISSLKPQASPAQVQTATGGPQSGHMCGERKNLCKWHPRPFLFFRFGTGDPLTCSSWQEEEKVPAPFHV